MVIVSGSVDSKEGNAGRNASRFTVPQARLAMQRSVALERLTAAGHLVKIVVRGATAGSSGRRLSRGVSSSSRRGHDP